MFNSMKMLVNRWGTAGRALLGTAVFGLALKDAVTRDEGNQNCTTTWSYIPGVGPYPNMKTCVPKEVSEAVKTFSNKQ